MPGKVNRIIFILSLLVLSSRSFAISGLPDSAYYTEKLHHWYRQSAQSIRTVSPREDAILDSILYYALKIPTRRNMANYFQERAIYAKNSNKIQMELSNIMVSLQLAPPDYPHRLRCRLYEDVGDIYYKLEKPNLSLIYYRKALQYALDNHLVKRIPQIYISLAIVYDFFELHSISYAYLKKIKPSKQDDKYSKQFYYVTLGELLSDMGAYKRSYTALDSARHYTNLFPNNKYKFMSLSYIYNKFGDIYKKQKQYDRAQHYYLKGLRYGKQSGTSYKSFLNYIDLTEIALKKGRLSTAKTYLTNIRQIRFGSLKFGSKMRYHRLLGDYYFLEGHYDSALTHYRLSQNFLKHRLKGTSSAHIRIGFSFAYNSIYKRQALCYYKKISAGQKTYNDSLLKYIQWGNAREYAANLFYRRKKDTPAFARLQNRLEALQKRILFNKDTTDDFETWHKLQDMRIDFLSRAMELPDTLAPALSPLTLKRLQNKLRERDSGMLLYLMEGKDAITVYVDADTLITRKLNGSEDDYRQWTRRLLHPLQSHALLDSARFEAVIANRLYQGLFAPLAKTVQLKKNLIIMPAEAISGLPFGLLMEKPPQQKSYLPMDGTDYWPMLLLQRYNFSFSPYISFLDNPLQWHWGKPSIAVFTQPENHAPLQTSPIARRIGWNLSPLVYSALETEQLKKNQPGISVYTGSRASRAVYLKNAAKYDIIHFATHAFADTEQNDFSGLLLSAGRDSSDDGLLMGYEIARLPIHSELVTLSACETGRGKIVEGEGIMGLPRIFIHSGAQSVLVTGWDIDDRYSAYLAPLFYKKLLMKGANKALALADAKKSIAENPQINKGRYNYRHPVFWAAFNLYGDPAPIRYFSFMWMLADGGIIILIFLIILFFRRRKQQIKTLR